MALFRLSPIARRRFANFRAHRRGWWSLWMFLVLFGISLLAEFIANDRPLLVKYEGSYYFPVVKAYMETEFGGDFPTEANYRDPFVQELIAKGDGYIVWPLLPFSHNTPSSFTALTPPNETHWLGTDQGARDVLANLIYGFRVSVLFGLTLTLLSSVVGVAAGAIQGYFGGRIDLYFQRVIEIWSNLPVLFMLIILASFVQPNFWWLLGLLLLFSWTSLVGVVRAEFLRARNLDYVRAAKALGARDTTVMFRHVLPNAMVATMTFLPFLLSGSITTLTSLDYLGFGLPPGTPSLGDLLRQGQSNVHAPWLGITAFLALSIMLTLLVFIGEAVRDAFDPRKASFAAAPPGKKRKAMPAAPGDAAHTKEAV